MAHRDVHEEFTEGCYGCHLLSINIGAAALPTRKAEVRRTEEKERLLSKDLPAYKRLRDDGLQPRNIDGSADLEGKVTSQFDIDLGHVVPRQQRERVKEGFAMAAEMESL